jgi:branched-chain amino acid transport system ATP-binding protein
MSPALLEVAGLNAFYGRAHILHDLSFAVGAGEALVLLGRNGAGKSTTLKAIMGLAPPAAEGLGGSVRFRGQRIDGMRPHEICRLGIGYVPEDRRIFSDLTVEENLAVGQRPARPGMAPWTLDRLFALFPNLAEVRARLAGRISGGEQQMLAIGRTLMGNPLAVLLDEPLEGLAPILAERLGERLAGLKREGLCIVLAEQNWRVAARLADRAAVLESGRIRHAGPMAEIAGDAALRARYLAL